MIKIVKKFIVLLIVLSVGAYAEEYKVLGMSFGMNKSKIESNSKFTCKEGLVGLKCETTPSKLGLKEELSDIDNINIFFYKSKLVLLTIVGLFVVNENKAEVESNDKAKKIVKLLECNNKQDIHCSYRLKAFSRVSNWISVYATIQIFDENLAKEFAEAREEAIKKEKRLELIKKKNKMDSLDFTK